MVLNARRNATKRKARCIMIHIDLWVYGTKRDKNGGLLGIKKGKNVRFYLLKAVFEPMKNCELTPK